MSYVTGISGNVISAASAGWAPTNSAEVSAIASAYATGGAQVVSAVGTETAYTPDGVSDVVTSINGNYISALSADSAFLAEYDDRGRLLTSLASESEVSAIASSYAESAVSGKADSSALSSYALSADVSGTVDLVSTQSANWGGSALALSAGPGVKLEKVGDTLVASTDETVLWSASGYVVGDASSQSITLTESPMNFNTIRVYGYRPLGTGTFGAAFSEDIDIQWLNSCAVNQFCCPYTINANGSFYVGCMGLSGISSTTWTETGGWHSNLTVSSNGCTTGVYAHVHKIVGINRISEA